jgi:phosphatidylserine/phosphatidylglycerophosphate/cardiolipin synthase-like enzyme
MGLTVGSVELYMGPPVLGAPDDLDEIIRTFIDEAKHTLLIAVQELDSRPIADSILAARARGVRMQVILEGDYLREVPPLDNPWTDGGDYEDNRTIYAALLRAGIDVISDLNAEVFHQKFVVRDVGTPTAALLTGSTNFTLTDTGKNPATNSVQVGNNLNHIVVLRGQTAAKAYAAEFERLRSGTFGELHERTESRPRAFNLGHLRIKPCFAPWQGPEMEIMKQMLKSANRIDFAMFTFAESSGIDDTMERLVKSVAIRGVLDREQGIQAWAATQPLKKAGVKLYENTPGNGVRKVHHKLMVIDSRLTIVGSFNYTAPAATLNDENIIVLGDLDTADPEADAAQREVAAYALAEIDRIVNKLSTKV